MAEYNIRALPIDAVVRALKSAGSRTVTEESIHADIARGAPVNENGTINLLNYAAWILKEDNGRGS